MNYEMFAWLSGETFTAGAVRGTTRFLAVTLPAASIYVAPVYTGVVLAETVAETMSEHRVGDFGTLSRSPELEVYETSALRMRQPF
jgi:hypothetical protein